MSYSHLERKMVLPLLKKKKKSRVFGVKSPAFLLLLCVPFFLLGGTNANKARLSEDGRENTRITYGRLPHTLVKRGKENSGF